MGESGMRRSSLGNHYREINKIYGINQINSTRRNRKTGVVSLSTDDPYHFPCNKGKRSDISALFYRRMWFGSHMTDSGKMVIIIRKRIMMPINGSTAIMIFPIGMSFE